MNTDAITPPTTQLKWVRAEDGIISGVCLQLARQLNIDPWLVRAVWLMTLCLFGTGLLAYLICTVALPRTDRLENANEKKILGVCVRLSQRGNLEVGLARLVALTLLVISCGAMIAAYVILYFLLPTTSTALSGQSNKSIF
ncbi:MAG: PspC domain-containing protein [Bdellovibrionaceae bacterium]|nr:PspC domain-containing protein [Pseudobdellovibrionaceae bacterium]